MNTDINVKELNTKDPLLAEWALLRIDYLQYIDKEDAERFAEEFFHKESVRYLLETSDFTLLSLLLSFLDAKKFEDNIHILKNKWNEWPDVLAFETATIIAKNSPQEAYGFFLENFPGIDDDEFNIEKFSAILRAIEYIQEEHARDLADRLISGYIRATNPFKSVLQLRVMEVAWKYEHPAFYDLFQSSFLENTFEDEDYCKPFLLSLADMFSVSGEDFNTIYEYYYENIELDYQDLKIFFKPFAPLEEIEKILKSLNRGKHEKVRDFCRKWLHVLSGEKLKELFERFLNDNDFITSIEEEMTLPLFYILLLSILIASMREKEVNPEGLSVQELIDAISLDIVEVPSFRDFVDYLKKKDKKEVIECILAELEKEDYWSLHTVRMMGELLYSEFIPHLLDLLSYDEISYIAAEALEKYGDISYDYIEKKILEMDKDGRDGALSVISKMDNYRVKRFVLDNFSLLFLKNKSRLLSIIDVYPDKIFIEKLKPFIDKGQLSIEHTYVILNKLYGLEGEEIQRIEKRIYEHNRDMEKIHEAMDEENIIDTIKPYLDVELNCGVCGDESYYRLQDIKVNFSDEESIDASLSEKLTCVNCNSSVEFGITVDGMDTVMSEVMKFAMLGSEEDRKRAMMKSPVTVISGLEGDEDINILQSLEYYEKEIKENPGDVSNYIYAGNIYRNTGRYLKAEEFYKKSIEIDPSSAEVYYALADIAARRDEYKDALEWLTRGQEYVDKVKYREDFEGSKGKFIRSYNEFYQEMLEKNAINQELLSPVRVGNIAGRNSPCPCGSGKKYKKCCLNK